MDDASKVRAAMLLAMYEHSKKKSRQGSNSAGPWDDLPSADIIEAKALGIGKCRQHLASLCPQAKSLFDRIGV